MGNYNTGMQKTGSSGVAKAGLVTGIIGTTLAVANSNNNCGRGCNNRLLGNLFGGNNNNCYVDEKEFAWAQAYNAKEAELAKEKAERYTEGVVIELYKEIIAETKAVDEKQSANIAVINGELVRLREENATLKSDVRCLAVVNEKEHEAITKDYTSLISLEAERRKCADTIISDDVACNYVRAKKVIPAEDICPQVQLKCPDVQLVEIISSTAQAFASAMGVNSAKATAK